MMAAKLKNWKSWQENKLHFSGVDRKLVGGGTLIQSAAVFSKDSEYVYINCGWGVRVFSVKTGLCTKVLNTLSIKYGRVLFCYASQDSVTIITFNSAKQIHLLFWDHKTTVIKKKAELKLPKKYISFVAVSACLAPNPFDRTVDDICIIIEDEHGVNFVLFFTTTAFKLADHPLNGKCVGFSKEGHLLSFGGPPDMRIMATISRGIGVCIYSLDGKKQQVGLLGGKHDVDWCSVTCHPMEPSVAVGDNIGRCVLFRNPLLQPRVKTIYHWHTLPCSVVTFTPAGSTMYTGGGEHVLVKWNIENPNVKNFLPRLSAPIVHISISSDNNLIAVSTLDNGIVLVDSCQKIKCVLQQFAWGVLSHKDAVLFPAGLNFDSVSRSIVLNSKPGHIQFYCPETETLSSVDVCQQNYLTQERSKVIVNTDVTHIAISCDSAWMATVETRHESHVSLELRLKLWQHDVPSKRWILNSVVEAPHSGLVISLRFKPVISSNDFTSDYVLVTTGQDSKFRLWSPTPIDSIYKKGVVWRCEGAAGYKDLCTGPACFSQDASLLAVAFQHIVTLWSSSNLKFQSSLSKFPPLVKQLEFGRDNCSHMLVTATETSITVWNLLTLCIQWTAELNPSILLSDPSSSFMAVFTRKNNLYIFHPFHSEPMHLEKLISSAKSQILGATFAARESLNYKAQQWMQKSILYYIDSNQELRSIESTDETQSVVLNLADDEEKSTLFSDLKRVQTLSKVERAERSVHPNRHQYGVVGATAMSEFLRVQCHTMPPVSTLCNSLLESFALSKKSVKEKERESNMDVDQELSDEGISEPTSDSDVEITEAKSKLLPKELTDSLKSVKPSEMRGSDQLFFIDIDDQVDSIISS